MVNTNGVLMQYFEWYLPDDGQHWNRLKEDAEHLASIGITKVWMPPAFKGTGTNDVGYGVYDIFDLGEFDQNGTVRTKYGTKDDYVEAIKKLKEVGIKPIADIVLNHKANGDKKETFTVMKMDPENRQKPLTEPYEIEGYTHFTFPGRNKEYNDFEWHWYHFSGLDYDARNDETGIFQVQGENKGWADNEEVDGEKGNFDYLMFNDIDFDHPEVIQNVKDWAKWFIETTGISGFRLDAIKHIDRNVVAELVSILTDALGAENFYVFGEYWNADYETKKDYLEDIEYEFDLVDVKLHMNLYEASEQGKSYDLRNIFNGTLMKDNPWSSVTFVDNHDTQRGQSLESTVQDWFKPIAYGIILLSQDGFPTIFYGDYYGIEGEFGQQSFQEIIDKLLFIRRTFAYGDQYDYFDDPNIIGWTRQGNETFPDGLATVISNGDGGEKRMQVSTAHPGEIFVDYLGHHQAEVTIEEGGWGTFPVNGGSISVWAPRDIEQHLDE